MKSIRGAGALLIVGLILGSFLGVFGIGGRGGGEGEGESASPPVQTNAKSTSTAVSESGPIVVTIDGGKLVVNGREVSPDEVADLADKRAKASEDDSPTVVTIRRTESATRGAREGLEAVLSSREILYRVE